jgi:hypothetical protein
LLDHELVEYLFALAIPRRDTKAQAKARIAQFGGIGPLLSADAETLKREGLTEGVVAALKIAEATALRMLETRLEGRPVLSRAVHEGGGTRSCHRRRAGTVEPTRDGTDVAFARDQPMVRTPSLAQS